MEYFPEKLANMGAPQVQSRLALREKLVALVDSRNSSDRPGLVVKNLVGHMGCNAQPGHAGYAGSAEVMQPPPAHSG